MATTVQQNPPAQRKLKGLGLHKNNLIVLYLS